MYNEMKVLDTIARELFGIPLDELPRDVLAAMLLSCRAGQKTALLNVSSALARHART